MSALLDGVIGRALFGGSPSCRSGSRPASAASEVGQQQQQQQSRDPPAAVRQALEGAAEELEGARGSAADAAAARAERSEEAADLALEEPHTPLAAAALPAGA